MNILEARRRALGKGVYKKTVEGNPAIAQGSLARRYPGITMQGWTEQDSTEGKNLFDKSEIVLSGTTITYMPVNVGDGEYTLSTNYIAPGRNDVFFLPGNVNTGALSSSNGVQHGTSRTVTSENGYVTVALRLSSDGTTSPLDYQIMLNEGSTALQYEPYTGGQPSPNPDYPQEIVNAGEYNEEGQKYEYQVKLTGKNLWDATKAADKSNWVASTTQKGYSDFAIDVSTGKSITVSFPEKLPTGLGYYVGIVVEENGTIRQWLYHSTVESLIFQQATVVSTGNKIWIRCTTYTITDFVSDNPLFQIEYGEERTDFQPYKEQTVLITSDRPLTKWDKLEKRNGQWGWVYKSEEIESYTDESVPGEYFSTTGRLSTGAQVWYETTAETFVPLTESEQAAMNELYTFRPTTVLSNDCDCNMELTYKTKKSLEVTD